MLTRKYLDDLLRRRILLLDGGMGMLIQNWKNHDGKPLSEEDYRGERFAFHTKAVKGCVDLLCLTKPEIISSLHEAYLESGADIIETCSLNSTETGLKSWGLEAYAYEISRESAAIARKAADKFSTPGKKRFVAGSMGPTSKSASISPDLNHPENRSVSWDELVSSYYDCVCGLTDGGADFVLIETMFDTLNAKAALFAVKKLSKERGTGIPAAVSATISESGRLLTGQDIEAFYISVLSLDPWAVGINCSFGAEKLTPYVEALSFIAEIPVMVYPNAGIPDRDGVYSDDPESMALQTEKWMEKKLVNIIGGCCGSTPAHIRAISKKTENKKPKSFSCNSNKDLIYLCGTKVIKTERKNINEVNGLTASLDFFSSLEQGNLEDAVENAKVRLPDGKEILLFNTDSASDPVKTMRSLIFLSYCFGESAVLPVCIESTKLKTIEEALKCLHGKGLVKGCGDEKIDKKIKELASMYGAEYIE